MRHPWRWIAGAVALVVIAGIAFGAYNFFKDDAPPPPSLSTTGTTTAGSFTGVDGTWKVQAGDGVYAGYRITEVFAGDIAHKTAVGRTPGVTGTISISGNVITAAEITAQMDQLTSDQQRRDNYIRTGGIETDKYPTATFKLTKQVALPAAPVKGQTVKVNAPGTLTLHGVTKPVTVPLEARWTGDTIEVAGSAPVKLADYDITPPDTGVVKVDDHGSFELALTFVSAS